MLDTLSIGFTVGNLDKALTFYTQVLAFKHLSTLELSGEGYEQFYGIPNARLRVATLSLGQEKLELTEFITPKGRPIPKDSKSNDLWFQHIAIVVSDMQAAYEQLSSYKVSAASHRPQRLPDWNKAAAGIEAFYFRDPEGHNLELISFPADKGDIRWQRHDALFLGIDHSAIAISQTEKSLSLYQSVLGLKLAGESENYGIEQENLSGVPNAHVRISGLRANSGLGIEFLDYSQVGKTMPITYANDLWFWTITLRSSNLETTQEKLLENGFKPSAITVLKDQGLGFTKGFLLKDPDGHFLRIVS